MAKSPELRPLRPAKVLEEIRSEFPFGPIPAIRRSSAMTATSESMLATNDDKNGGTRRAQGRPSRRLGKHCPVAAA